jgi:transcription antitermination factor NusG
MQSNNEADQWFALRVKGRSEKAISRVLMDKGYESFLPTYTPDFVQPVGGKRVDLPCFPGYVFCRFDVQRRLPILITPGVIHVVGVGRAPYPVDEGEIASLQRATEQRLLIRPGEYLEVGQKVRIVDGTLRGIEGTLLELKNSFQLVLSITLLRRSVRVEISRDMVQACAPPAFPYRRGQNRVIQGRDASVVNLSRRMHPQQYLKKGTYD